MPNVTLWLGGIILALCVVIGGQQLRVSALKTEIATMRADYAMQSAQAQAKARETEARYQSDAQQAANKAQEELANAQTAATAARSDADSLRREVDRLRKSRGATCAATAAGRGKAEESAFGVLAELFDESVKRNQVLAAEADAARIAGKTCEGVYNATR